MKALILLAAAPLLALAGPLPGDAPADTVRAFLAAFNEHKVEAMLAYTQPQVHWNHIKGQKVDTEADTQAEFGAAMADYFQTLPNAKADILSLTESGNYVSILERISWDNDGETGSQCSIGVYELSGGKISSIWYYPAHACNPEVAPEIGVLQETRQ
ncbi:nuclear transport factor 2 family protein [Shewanella cyperi]|uniref:Nuclear transport factor 2 family protein n=1 Tax=Shewanella cyperi TaxID=2814292 RepID=A0A974XNA9_9GAMM|nr:nuclear transport factor 2 family protein [Shewanella cyperi]QSX30383.1 nuclear transport factor 2 family protein [Shewanella cyperi]